MSERRTRSGGSAQRSGPGAPSPTQSLRRSQRKSGPDLPSTLPEIWPKAPHAAPVRKPIVLKKIVAQPVEIPPVHTPRRSPRSPRGRRKAYSKPVVKPEVQPAEKPKPEEPQVSGEPGLEPSSSAQKLDLQPEPTVTFLFTLLGTSEPTESKDPEEDLEIQESRFLDTEDWGPQRTTKEISHLQNDCMRLWESLSTIQADNWALGEKLQNLPTFSYENLRKEAKALQEEVKAVVEGAHAVREDAQAFPEDAQAFPEDA
ncbi:sororin isoform X2 [Zalophus californianus]|uniref:Sororin isoform X2 n=1 Tax=Zalophus californianus TaxID=9704 RepID=A0A6J2BV75_ZALCA|nr:sororin isoform X2 [Zalophus californianus]